MKKFLYAACGVIIMLLVAIFAYSCEEVKRHLTEDKAEYVLSEMGVEQYVDSIMNPEFSELSEVLSEQNIMVGEAYTDSVFIHIPPEILRNVATVVLKRGSATKNQIVMEYLANKDIYESLPPPEEKSTSNDTPKNDNATKNNTTVTEAPQSGVESVSETSFNYRDTVINGKKHRIETKTITYD